MSRTVERTSDDSNLDAARASAALLHARLPDGIQYSVFAVAAIGAAARPVQFNRSVPARFHGETRLLV